MKIFYIVLFFTVSQHSIYSQTILFQETFEDAVDSDYTASTPFNDSGNDHWNRTDGTDINNTSSAYSGYSGTFFWAAEDTDDNGGNGNDEQVIDITNINITGYNELQITGLFGAGNENPAGSSAYDLADHIRVQYSIDNGPFNDILWFSYVDNGDNFNEPIAFDANFDNDGEGAVLTSSMQLFTGSLPVASIGNIMDVKILVYMDSGNEEIGFDDITVQGSEIVVMPVEFTNFSGAIKNNSVDLTWQTASEINNEEFQIERSNDDSSYTTLGKVSGEGNSTNVQNYWFCDRNPLNGINYYRIKQIDFDGQYEYSKVVSVTNRNSNISVAPTNTYDIFKVTVDQDAVSDILVYNMAGQVVTNLSKVQGTQTIDASLYPKGTYIVSVVTNGITQTERIVKL